MLRAVEPSQIRLSHSLALARVREFMDEDVYGQLNSAKVARSLQYKELEAMGLAIRQGSNTVPTTSPRAGNALMRLSVL